MRLISMPLRSSHQLRRNGLTLGAALLITVLGAPPTLLAQQFDPASSTTSSSSESAALNLPISELPDAPSALQNPQSTQTQPPTPPQQTSTDPYAVSPNG